MQGLFQINLIWTDCFGMNMLVLLNVDKKIFFFYNKLDQKLKKSPPTQLKIFTPVLIQPQIVCTLEIY